MSTSKGNLAKNLLLEIFSPGERRARNCAGCSKCKGKVSQPLEQSKLMAIKEFVFEQYPDVPVKLQGQVSKEECVKAINAFLRKKGGYLLKNKTKIWRESKVENIVLKSEFQPCPLVRYSKKEHLNQIPVTSCYFFLIYCLYDKFQ